MSDSFVTSWTLAHQAPLSMGFPRQEYWNELPFLFPSPGDFPNPGIEITSPALQADFLLLSHPLSSVQSSCSVMSYSLKSHGLQHTRLPCPSPTPGACSNSCPWVSDAIQHLILCSLLLLPSIFPSIGVFSNESVLHIRWPKYGLSKIDSFFKKSRVKLSGKEVWYTTNFLFIF